MTGIRYITGLVELNCYGMQLTTLDVSGCTNLTTLDYSGNQLMTLNLDSNTALQEARCGEQSRSMELDRREDGNWSLDLNKYVEEPQKISNLSAKEIQGSTIENNIVIWTNQTQLPEITYTYQAGASYPMKGPSS